MTKKVAKKEAPVAKKAAAPAAAAPWMLSGSKGRQVAAVFGKASVSQLQTLVGARADGKFGVETRTKTKDFVVKSGDADKAKKVGSLIGDSDLMAGKVAAKKAEAKKPEAKKADAKKDDKKVEAKKDAKMDKKVEAKKPEAKMEAKKDDKKADVKKVDATKKVEAKKEEAKK